MEQGRHDAVDEVYRRDHVRLQRALLAQCGHPHLAADAEAEAFRQALSAQTTIRNHRAWIWAAAFRIAKGMLANATLTAEDLDGRYDGDPGELVEFLDLLSSLSDQQRAIVVLRYAGGFNGREIAELLNTSHGAVRVQLHRAHQHLKERLVRT